MNNLDTLKEIIIKLLEACAEDPGSANELAAFLKKECLFPGTQMPAQRTMGAPKDPIKLTLNWLRNKQYAIHYTEEAQPLNMDNGSTIFTQQKNEWRTTKATAFIYRELVSAVKAGEIPLAESEVPGFMINYLRDKNGKEITKNATDKAAKSRLIFKMS
jgi:hypothetical protein